MAERNSKGQFVKGSGGTSKKSKGKKSKGKTSKKSKGLDARVAQLEANQGRIISAHNALESRVSEHDRVIARLSSVVGERFRVIKGGKRSKAA